MYNNIAEIKQNLQEISNIMNKKQPKNEYEQFIRFIGLSGLVISLSTFLLTLLGVIDLRIVNNIEVNPMLDGIIKSSLYLLNCYFGIRIVTLNKISLCIMGCVLIFPFYLLFNCSGFNYLTNFILLIVIIVESNHKLKKCIFKYIMFAIISILYQFVSNTIKFNSNIFNNLEVNSIVCLLFSIDLFLFYFYLLSVSKRKEEISYGLGLEHILFAKERSVSRVNEFSKEVLTTRQRFIFSVLVQGYQLFQLLVVLAIGLLNNLLAELIIMLIMFWIGRKILIVSWHSNKLWVCSSITFLSFYVLTKITPPLEISLFMVVVTSSLFIWIMHYLGVKEHELEYLQKRYETDFTKFGFTPKESEFINDWKISGMSTKDLMEKYKRSEEAIKKYKNRLNKKLESGNCLPFVN